jgi:hypothetical protein
MVLEQPSDAALVSMLVEPAKAAGHVFEDDEMPEEMAAAVVGETGALPLLSFAAEALWKLRDRDGRVLLRSAYERIGGVEARLVRVRGELRT